MKITYLVPRKEYLTKMSRVRFHQIKAIGKAAEVIWSGPGWDNYDSERSVHDNLLSLYKGRLPDLVIVFDHRTLIGLTETSVPRCTIMNEMHDADGYRGNALNLMVKNKYDLIICHHENEMNDPYFSSVRKRCYHLPHCAEASIFKDYGLSKTVDVLLCGNIRFEKYVFRKRLVRLIDDLRNTGVNAQVHQHPGGFHDDAHTDRYLVEFARAINQAKICLTCSSIYKCAFGKYAEIPMCRSLLAADVPGERSDFFRKFMIALNPEDSNQAIISQLKYYLEHDEERLALTEAGYKINHAECKMEDYSRRFLDIAERFLRMRKTFL